MPLSTTERINEDNEARSQAFSHLRTLFGEWPEILDEHSCSVHKPDNPPTHTHTQEHRDT